MTGGRTITVLVSEPNAVGSFVYLPYVWAVLRSYCDHEGGLGDRCTWLDPIYHKGAPRDLLRPFDGTRIDVLALSCYTWNWQLQCQIAGLVKQQHPQCLVVAGGPDPDYKDPAFFQKHPYIDIVVIRDGEIPFRSILLTVLEGKREFRHVPGLCLPVAESAPDGSSRRVSVLTEAPQVPREFRHSPYLDYDGFYQGLARRHGRGNFSMVWETNRGCPYGCSFCDWGSNTMSKVRRFDMARVEAEADWIGKLGALFVFLADANFGILPRDLDITDVVVAAHRRYGYPRFLYYSPAKNNPDRAFAIAKKLSASTLAPTHTLSIQHTDDAVLAATDRANISVDKQKEVVRRCLADRIPIDVQLICGIPGDTYEKWKTCLTDIMEWGVHEKYYIFPYCILPNAPAADPEYMRRWAIETIERRVAGEHVHGFRDRHSESELIRMPLIVATKTFTTGDWVRMQAYAATAKALHGCGVTRHVALYLRSTHGIPLKRFYDAVIDDFVTQVEPARAWYRAVAGVYETLLAEPAATDDIALDGLPWYVSADRWLFVKICRQPTAFFEALTAFLDRTFGRWPQLESVIRYQQDLLVTPDRGDDDRVIRTRFDWPGYFHRALDGPPPDELAEPDPLPNGVVTREQHPWATTASQYAGVPLEERVAAWAKQVAFFRSTTRVTNYAVITARPGPVAG